jgi:CheY-like chemotaxis protein
MSLVELEDKEKVREHLGRIEVASNFLLSMINEVLDYSVITNGKMLLRHEPFCLDQVIDPLYQLLTPHFHTKNQSFEIKSNGILIKNLIGDPLRLSQIIMNLLTNSMKYTAVGGKILLELTQYKKSDNVYVLEARISDTGIGMSEKFMANMFEPYARAEKKNEFNQDSTGLGLYITKNLISIMGGEISATSKLMEGTTFVVRIPFEIQKESNQINDNIKNNFFSPEDYNFTGKNILIAEDNSDMLEITSEILKLSGCSIIPAQNGRQALDAFMSSSKGDIDVILMDIRMPEMDGFQAIEKIQSGDHPDSKSIPIIAFTANDDNFVNENIGGSRVDEFVNKPVDFSRLFIILDHLLKGAVPRESV